MVSAEFEGKDLQSQGEITKLPGRSQDADMLELERAFGKEVADIAVILGPIKDKTYNVIYREAPNALFNRYKDTYLAALELVDVHNQQFQRIREGEGDNAEIITMQLIQLLIGISLWKRFNTMRNIELKYVDAETVDKAYGLRVSSIISSMVVRMGGLSIEDILRDDKEVDNQDIFFHVASCALAATSHDKRDIDTKQPYVLSEYPAIRDVGGYQAAIRMFAIGFLSDELNNLLKRYGSGRFGKEGQEWSRNISYITSKLVKAQKDVLISLQNPEEKEFIDVAVRLSELMDKYPDRTYLLFKLLKLENDGDVINFYRTMNGHSEDPEYGEFFNQVSTVLKRDIDSLASESIPSIDRQDMFLKTELHEEELIKPDFSLLMQGIAGKQGLLPEKYEVDLADIDFGDLIKPTKVLFDFDKKRATSFTVRFIYENKEGEEDFIDFYGDTKTKEYDWNFLEKPSDAAFLWRNVSEAAMNVFKQVSMEIQSIAERKRQGGKSQVSQSRVKREYVSRDEIYDLRKEARKQAVEAFNTGALESFATRDNKVSNNVNIPNNLREAFDLLRLSNDDTQKLLEEIKKKNEDGSLQMSKLRKPGKDGTDRFVYKTRVLGGVVRVLLRLVDSDEPGVRNFEIVRGGYRKDAYRDENLE